MRHILILGLSLVLTFNTAYADKVLLSRPATRTFIREMVNQYHFDRRQLVAILTEAKFQPKIIESMERPYEKKTWDVYQSLFLTPARLHAGIAFWQANQATLARAEKEFGVPADMIVAIIGIETLYGKNQGNYRVLDALTTLAFNYPKRSEFFTKELKEYLLLCREHGVPATRYMGSYAGAIGKPQFMPSSYRFYAVNYTGKGHPDLIGEDRDVIGSVANYFSKHGWQQNQPIAQPAKLVGDGYKTLFANAKTPNYTYSHLLAAGIQPQQSEFPHPPKQAGFIELITQVGQEYWLAYPNFYVITHYNTSPQYAMVAYLFSQQLRAQWALMHTNHPQTAHV
jgi:membrane-bound lytic murein transglycosylase B